MSQTENKASVSKFAIVRKIAELLNLGTDGKLDSFLTRVVKTLSNEMKTLVKNLDTIDFRYKADRESLEDELEDAEEALATAYLNVNIDSINTNELQKAHVEEYLDMLDNHLEEVENVKSRLEKLDKRNEADIAETNERLESLKKRIAAISAE
jgi:ABC-type Zn uptake system ZnuABC Zn-binding protein ZnuA